MSTDMFEARDRSDPAQREADLFARLPDFIAHAQATAPGWARHLAGVDASAVTGREKLAELPVLRKSDLMTLQKGQPPFGGFLSGGLSGVERVFMSPGPIFEPQPVGADPWNGARALHAAGFRPGDLVFNAFAYHLTPGGFILDCGARALGCTVLPAGVGNTDLQLEAIETLKPVAFVGTPDHLKILLDKAQEQGRDASSFKRALVSGGALFPSLRQEYADRGIDVSQCYATAELGVIAYESSAREGMIVNEDYIVEIVRPGTGDPVGDGEVGELVVTNFNKTYPMIRFGTGDLSAVLPGVSSCGRTNRRIGGWMGRADQRTKIKGMFVDPAQIAELVKTHDEVLKARLTVTRVGESDAMTLAIEAASGGTTLVEAVGGTLKAVTGLKGMVEVAAPGSLPNDGKVISDERNYG